MSNSRPPHILHVSLPWLPTGNDSNGNPAYVILDGIELRGVRHVDIKASVNEPTEITIVLTGEVIPLPPEYEGMKDSERSPWDEPVAEH